MHAILCGCSSGMTFVLCYKNDDSHKLTVGGGVGITQMISADHLRQYAES